MVAIVFFSHDDQSKPLEEKLEKLFNDPQANSMLTTVMDKLFPAGETWGHSDAYPQLGGLHRVRESIIAKYGEDEMDPHNTCNELFHLYKVAQENPENLLSDADIKGLELLTKRVITAVKTSDESAVKRAVLSNWDRVDIKFGREM